MIILLFSLFLPIILGFVLVCIFWPRLEVKCDLLYKISLGTGIGIGISSCIFFISLVTFGASIKSLILIELALLLIFGSIFIYRLRSKKDLQPIVQFDDTTSTKTWLFWTLIAGLSINLVSSFSVMIFQSITNPHGQWDAIAIWNMRARFLFRGGDNWADGFSNAMSHTDYPLLLSGFVARSWNYVGNDNVLVPIAIGMIFTLATLGLMYTSLSVLRNKIQGLLASMMLLGAPIFVLYGVSQYADVSLGFYFLATFSLFCLTDVLPKLRYELILLAGFSASLSAWTKNEGLLFVLAILAARVVVLFVMREWKKTLQDVLCFILGLLPVMLIILYFKTELAGPSDFFLNQNYSLTIAKATDMSRYLMIAKAFLGGIYHFSNLIFSPVILLALYIAIIGIKIEKNQLPGLFTSLIALGFMMLGYFSVYIITPHDLKWHLDTSVYRLILQLWPSFLFVYFLIVSPPEEILLIRKKNHESGLEIEHNPALV